MSYIAQMIVEGVRYLHHDPYLGGLVFRTVQLAVLSTLIAGILGFPAACVIGLGRSRASRWSLVVANAGLGLPPVAVGVYFYMVLGRHHTPWGSYWLPTMNGMVLAQTLLSLPVIIALGAVAIRRLPAGLVDQASAFGARGWRLGLFTLREARIGVVSAVIVALGSAISEVGAVTIIGGNSTQTTATLASQIINDIHNSVTGVPAAVEHFIVLLGMMLVLGVILTIVQHPGRGRLRRPSAEGARA